jgi:hypothetical protein
VSALLALLLVSAPVLEAELDSQTREDDELPPASILPYTPRFDGKTLPNLVCGPKVSSAKVQQLLDEGTRNADSKRPDAVRRAVAQLQKALATDPRAGWAYLILGSAHAKLGENAAGTQAYETFLLSCRTYPNSDRVQRILTDYWLATGGKGSTVPRR